VLWRPWSFPLSPRIAGCHFTPPLSDVPHLYGTPSFQGKLPVGECTLFLFALIAAHGVLFSYHYLYKITEDPGVDVATREALFASIATVSCGINATAGRIAPLGWCNVLGACVRIAPGHEQVRVSRSLSDQTGFIASEMDAMGLLFFEVDGRVTDASDTFLRMIGYPREDLGRRLASNWAASRRRLTTKPTRRRWRILPAAALPRRMKRNSFTRTAASCPVLQGCARLKADAESLQFAMRSTCANRKPLRRSSHNSTAQLHDRVHELETLLELAQVGENRAGQRSHCQRITVNGSLAAMLAVAPNANASLTASDDAAGTDSRSVRDGIPLSPEASPCSRRRHGSAALEPGIRDPTHDGQSIRVLTRLRPCSTTRDAARLHWRVYRHHHASGWKRNCRPTPNICRIIRIAQGPSWTCCRLRVLISPGAAISDLRESRGATKWPGGRLALGCAGERTPKSTTSPTPAAGPLPREEFPGLRAAKGEISTAWKSNWRLAGATHRYE